MDHRPDDDLPPGLDDWRDTTLESGLYFVTNPTNSYQWFQWNQTSATIDKAFLTAYPMLSNLPKSNGDNFLAAAVSTCSISVRHWTSLNALKFVFTRNDDGSYYISNWRDSGRSPYERFLQVFNGYPALAQPKSKCHLYRDKHNDSYVYVIDISLD